MPMIDLYAVADLFPAHADRQLAEELTLALLKAEGVESRADALEQHGCVHPSHAAERGEHRRGWCGANRPRAGADAAWCAPARRTEAARRRDHPDRLEGLRRPDAGGPHLGAAYRSGRGRLGPRRHRVREGGVRRAGRARESQAVTLGLLPGAGGTQRLPRTIGTRAALMHILIARRANHD